MKWSERLAASIALADSLPQELRDHCSVLSHGAVQVTMYCPEGDRIARDFVALHYPGTKISAVHDFNTYATCSAVLNGVELKWSKRVTLRMEDGE